MSPRTTSQPTNYCRQILTQWADIDASNPHGAGLDPEMLKYRREIAGLIRESEKFLLPNGGLLLDDQHFRGIADDDLRLPYPVICLEYSMVDGAPLRPGQVLCTRRVALCSEEGDWISIRSVAFYDQVKLWLPIPKIRLPRTGCIRPGSDPRGADIFMFFTRPEVDLHDYADEVRALLGLLNALACSNVTTERTPVKNAKQKPGALPFDSYHYLVLRNRYETGCTGRTGIGAGRSPREHLRRGHIRRLPTGAKTWVNATVVNAGRAGGTVRKTYVVQP